jgi:hypothetical protein
MNDPDWREVVRHMDDSEDDFEVNGVRFISDDEIDIIQCEELESDLYILGCFNAGFLAGWSMWIAEMLALPVFAITFTNYFSTSSSEFSPRNLSKGSIPVRSNLCKHYWCEESGQIE